MRDKHVESSQKQELGGCLTMPICPAAGGAGSRYRKPCIWAFSDNLRKTGLSDSLLWPGSLRAMKRNRKISCYWLKVI